MKQRYIQTFVLLPLIHSTCQAASEMSDASPNGLRCSSRGPLGGDRSPLNQALTLPPFGVNLPFPVVSSRVGDKCVYGQTAEMLPQRGGC